MVLQRQEIKQPSKKCQEPGEPFGPDSRCRQAWGLSRKQWLCSGGKRCLRRRRGKALAGIEIRGWCLLEADAAGSHGSLSAAHGKPRSAAASKAHKAISSAFYKSLVEEAFTSC